MSWRSGLQAPVRNPANCLRVSTASGVTKLKVPASVRYCSTARATNSADRSWWVATAAPAQNLRAVLIARKSAFIAGGMYR